MYAKHKQKFHTTRCQPCFLDGKDELATVWCYECQEALCSHELHQSSVTFNENHHTVNVKYIPQKDILKGESNKNNEFQEKLMVVDDSVEHRQNKDISTLEPNKRDRQVQISVHSPNSFHQAQVVCLKNSKLTFSFKTFFELKSSSKATGLDITNDGHVISFMKTSGRPPMRWEKYSLTGEHLGSCLMKLPISGVAVLPDNETLAVSTSSSGDSCIQFANINSIEPLEKTITVPEKVAGLHCSRKSIVAGGTGSLYLLDLSGELLHKEDIENSKWFPIPFVRLTKSDVIIYSDTNAVYSVSRGKDKVRLYKCPITDGIQGMDVDQQGNIYLAITEISEVIKLSPDGKQIETVLGKDDGLSKPEAICFEKTFKFMLVANNRGQKLTIFECK